MSESNTVPAEINITIYVECPKCKQSFDLMDHNYNDDGMVMDQISLRSDDGGPEPKDFKIEALCVNDECEHEFLVKGVEW